MVVLGLAAVFVYARVSDQLSESIDDGLQTRVAELAALVDSSQGERPRLQSARLDREDAFSQVLDYRGRVVASTLRQGSGPALSRAEIAATRRGQVLAPGRKVPGIDGTARIRAVRAHPYVVVAGASEADREETLDGLVRAFAIGAPIALLLALGAGYLLAGRGLAPVERMRRRAERITLEHSDDRLPLPPVRDEIHQLGATLNAMLDRIEASLERERAFVADASHELRTPLAILRTELELAGRPGRSDEEVRAALRSAAEEVDRLSRLAEDLLVIARSDQGRLPIAPESVAADELLERVRDRFAPRAAEAGREVVVAASAGARSEVDPLRMEQALGNLVDNALRHGAGDVRVSAGRDVFEVSDDGPGFPADLGDEAFERFTRGGGRAGDSTGLGLAIVRAVAEAHGGSAAIASTGSPTTVQIRIPVSRPSHPGAPR
jgi:signal transduction histidine kinase